MTRDPRPRAARPVTDEHDAPTRELAPLAALRLDSRATPERFEALAARIDAAVQGELARRAAAPSLRDRDRGQLASPPWLGGLLPNALARALRPASLAAAAAVVLAVGLAQREDAATSTAAPAGDPVALIASDASVQRALSVDAREATWITAHASPDDDELARLLVAGVSR